MDGVNWHWNFKIGSRLHWAKVRWDKWQISGSLWRKYIVIKKKKIYQTPSMYICLEHLHFRWA